jgi:hypothetical protein
MYYSSRASPFSSNCLGIPYDVMRSRFQPKPLSNKVKLLNRRNESHHHRMYESKPCEIHLPNSNNAGLSSTIARLSSLAGLEKKIRLLVFTRLIPFIDLTSQKVTQMSWEMDSPYRETILIIAFLA